MSPPENKHYDLTHTVAPYLDTHLVFPLLQFLLNPGKKTNPSLSSSSPEDAESPSTSDASAVACGYNLHDIHLAQLNILAQTNMVDFAVQFAQKAGIANDLVEEMQGKRAGVVQEMEEKRKGAEKVLAVLENGELMKQLKQDKQFHLQHLMENYQVTESSVDSLYKYAKFQYDCGNYAGAAEYLWYFRNLIPQTPDSHDKIFSATWGKFASEILMQNWDAALEDMNLLKEMIDSKQIYISPLKQLQQRSWLIHWSLFVFFNHPNGRNGIIDMFLQDRYMNTIQTVCPHVLRYLTTAVITNKRRRNVLKELVRIIQQEQYSYKDPITEFVESLYVHFNFDLAQQKLKECEEVLKNDFFLVSLREEFVENAKLFIFETYCRIHNCLDISMLANNLGMEEKYAEKWIVNLIRNASLDAKIDSAQNQVMMGNSTNSVYDNVVEKTKGLAFRSYVLAGAVRDRLKNSENRS